MNKLVKIQKIRNQTKLNQLKLKNFFNQKLVKINKIVKIKKLNQIRSQRKLINQLTLK